MLSKLVPVRSRTSEPRTARTKASAAAEERMRVNRIVNERKGEEGDGWCAVRPTAERFIGRQVSTCHLELIYPVLVSNPDH